VKQYEIHYADHHWRKRNYGGFYVLIRQEGDVWLCCAIATEDPKFEAIELNELDEDFDATGLDHTSYVFDAEYSSIPIGKIGAPIGDLRGYLLSNFKDKSGL